MIPKFRAYDGGSLSHMYQPEDVMVGGGNIWIIDEDGVAGEWIVNNDLNLMQSTGLHDKNGKEIFEGDVITIEVDDTGTPINARVFQNSKIGVLMFHVFEDNEDVPMVELLEDNSVAFEIIGNIYENQELLEEKQ
nr:MAG TPA: YopX protein [Caudoviricetes sp.]